MLAQGAKGLTEMKAAADACYAMSEPGKHSPMYGMIDFRRRKVLLKLVVEGTSRLIQGALATTPFGKFPVAANRLSHSARAGALDLRNRPLYQPRDHLRDHVHRAVE